MKKLLIGILILALLVTISGCLAVRADSLWVNPTGYNDLEDKWSNELNAVDGSVITWARYDGDSPGWSTPLIFTVEESNINAIQFYYQANGAGKVSLKVFYDESWHDAGIISDHEARWNIIELDDSYLISKVKIEIYSPTSPFAMFLYGIQFRLRSAVATPEPTIETTPTPTPTPTPEPTQGITPSTGVKTKVLLVNLEDVNMPGTYSSHATWIADKDISIIGSYVYVFTDFGIAGTTASLSPGDGSAIAELSLNPAKKADGMIARTSCKWHYDAGFTSISGDMTSEDYMMLPAGESIDVAEGGRVYLHINLSVQGFVNGAVGDIIGIANIYYK